MSVIRVTRKPNRVSLSESTDGVLEISDTWQIQTDSKYDDPLLIAYADGVPRLRSQYVSAGGIALPAWCKSRQLRPVSADTQGDVYLLDAKFDSETSPIEDPLRRPPDISYSFAKYGVVVEEDTEGKPVVNSAKQVFDPPVEIDDSRPTVVIERNERTFSFAMAVDYQDAVNSDTWWGLEAGIAKMMQITGQPSVENGISFYRVRYEIELRREGWKKRILDRGFYERIDGKLKVIKDDDQTSSPEPDLLDGKGRVLKKDADPVFLEFDVYKKRPFNRLRLNSPGSDL